jgi:hypothetical protein
VEEMVIVGGAVVGQSLKSVKLQQVLHTLWRCFVCIYKHHADQLGQCSG